MRAPSTASGHRVSESFAGHESVDHGADEFARPGEDGGPAVHNNTAESFNSLIERAKFGVFHMMSKKHLHRYLAEIEFRWNERYVVPVRTGKGERMIVEHTKYASRLFTLFKRANGRQLRRSQFGGLFEPAPS